ncbi:hypothetical protein FSB73_18235 [Arachidicoccus ginsenosidivorans]|uniref:Uncharacterized protein n=1 Tax=Arachidicoccus ginsenosidivorans TaxID=496057 RepID=A0A5B8VP46_9BACT|nr:hypothetical protein [Arachidicoccus ginsenosidivorans]QEC73320.1 hypothetical protein FSB73_18235 [Arachidicoccus ginsenosidivorans]
MRNLLFFVIVIATVGITACSKYSDSSLHPIDPVVSAIKGKWSVHSSSGINVPSDAALGKSPFLDTLVFTGSNGYFIIDNNDTIDRGQFSLGQGEAINGDGKLQPYDSILLKTSSLASNSIYPSVYYFNIKADTLITSPNFYNDPFLTEKVINYIKN